MRIAFVHSKCRPFRYETFEALQKKYDIDFYFTDKIVNTLENRIELKSYKIPCMQDFHFVPDLRRNLESKDYDIYISTDLGYHITYITYSVAKKKNKKFILWNEQWKNILHPRRLLITYPLENKILKNADAILAFGKKAQSFSLSRGAEQDRIVLTPNIVPDNIKLTSDIQYGMKEKKVILCIGRLIPIKGQDYLIRAFKKVCEKRKDVRLILAGEGPSFKKLSNLVNKFELNNYIEITGKRVEGNEKWDLFNSCDIFILPSVYRRTPEAWGLVVNEAAMFEKPIITTNMTGVDGEIVQHKKSGLVVQEKNIDELANAIIYLLENKDEREKFGKNAKKIVKEKYNLNVMLDSFNKAINIALKR
ncbi:glycosyltransferase family 4 protein [Metabacillus halosaccharovorans]|uniref:glycosyltransferase family 4 protein n=1 Tax=Metabacillus halosaccharovorans TaxID=930124 RepID=UPI001C1FF9F6|nr:glycosyltransferase family 4 protein [Metabacillus halosaccharovorans]MBU7594460.1 glycosyltransferase family 4 protein [Metabacillus halosaccharovorans]